jgi:capsular polysaccharide transport system ATP-binding protein
LHDARTRTNKAMIELFDVSKGYATDRGFHPVLDRVNIRFDKGVNVGIIGRNGAGKSTLIGLLAGALEPDSGIIHRDARISWPVGFGGGAHGVLTAEENCRFVARAYGEDVDRVVDFAREFSELGEYFYLPVKTYSSGMRARLNFALTMAFPFDFYLIDEGMATGDARFKDKSKRLFESRRGQSAVIIVSHNLRTVKRYSDRVAVLLHGRLTMFDTVEEAQQLYRIES